MRDELPEHVRLLKEARDAGLLSGALGSAIAGNMALGITDEFAMEWLRTRVRKHEIRRALAGPFDRPPRSSGPVVLGLDQGGRPVRVPLQFLNAHSLTVGGSGSGKTNKSRFLALAIAPHLRGLWLLDCRKSEFGMLAPLLARYRIDLIHLRAREMRVNPLQVPEWVDPRAWAAAVSHMLDHVLQLQSRSSKLVHATVLELYERHGVDRVRTITQPTVLYPTLFELREAIAGAQGAHPQAKSAIVDALDPVLLSLGPSVLGFRFGWSPHALSRHHLALALGEVSRAEQDLLINTLLLSEFSARIARGMSNVPLDLYVILDEAARLCSASHPSAIVTDMLGLVRGAGIGLDMSVQSAHDLHPVVLSNSAFKCIGRCGASTDYDAIGSAMALSPEQRRFAMHTLSPGTFVAQLGEGAWRRPFILNVPLIRTTPDTPEPDNWRRLALPTRPI